MRTNPLTEEEQKSLVIFRERIIGRALSTERIDRDKAENAYNALLVSMGHEPVSNFIWVDSPYQLHTKLEDQLSDKLWDQLRDQLRGQLRDQLSDKLWGQLWDQLSDKLWGQLDQWELQYYAWMEYASDLEGVVVDQDKLKRLKLLVELGEHAFWILPLKDGAVFCDRPTYIQRDHEHNLHSVNHKAIEFADGWGMYSIHGMRFPDELGEKLTTGSLTAKDLASIDDVDQRKVAMTFLSGEDFIKEMKAELVHEGELQRFKHLPKRGIVRATSRMKTDVEVTNRLYKVPKGDVYDEDKYFLYYKNPSTSEMHISFVTNFVKELGQDADAIMARKHNTTKEEFLSGRGA